MVVLASKSPRRNELLKKLVDNFIVFPSSFDENNIKTNPKNLAKKLAKAKANDVFLKFQDDLIISADTTVILNNIVFGKPKDKDDAFLMLKKLNKKKHIVITGFCLKSKYFEITKKVKTKVYFSFLTDKQIKDYIDHGNPLDKAGSYGIQDKEYNIVEKIKGSYTNVVGLPLEKLEKELNKIKKKYKNLFF